MDRRSPSLPANLSRGLRSLRITVAVAASMTLVLGCSAKGDDDRGTDDTSWRESLAQLCSEAELSRAPDVLQRPLRSIDLSTVEADQLASVAAYVDALVDDGADLISDLQNAMSASGRDERLSAGRVAAEIESLRAMAERQSEPSDLTRSIARAMRLHTTGNSFADVVGVAECRDSVGFLPLDPPSATEPVVAIEECFSDPAFALRTGAVPAAGGDPESAGGAAALVPCDEPHDYQTFARFEFPGGPGGPFPGELAVAYFSVVECTDRLDALLDSDFASTDYTFVGSELTDTEWRDGDLTMTCDAYRADSQRLDAGIAGEL